MPPPQRSSAAMWCALLSFPGKEAFREHLLGMEISEGGGRGYQSSEAPVGLLDLSQQPTLGASTVYDRDYMTQETEQVFPESIWDGIMSSGQVEQSVLQDTGKDPLIRHRPLEWSESETIRKKLSLMLHKTPNTVPLDCNRYRVVKEGVNTEKSMRR